MSASQPTHTPSDVELLLAAGRELEHAAARLALAGMLAGCRSPTSAVWTFSCSAGAIVLRNGRLEIKPSDVSATSAPTAEKPGHKLSS